MSQDQYQARTTSDRLLFCWNAARQSYRALDAGTRRVIATAFKLLVFAYFLFCILILALRYVVLPNIDNYKPDIERLASRAIGNRVAIASIEASWKGFRPNLNLSEVTVHDKFGNASLHLPSVSATLSWWSLVAGTLRLHSLEINRPDVEIRRDADGKLYVAGIFVDTAHPSESGGADWVLSQREILIRDGRLRWNDYQRAAPELVLEGVTVALRNRWRHHQFALKAAPPARFAGPIDVRAAFDHPHFADRISNFRRWTGEVYADLPNTDLTVWRSYFDYPIEVQRGKGSVRAWLNFDHARVADLTADLGLANVSTRLRQDLEPLNLVHANGRISVREELGPDGGDEAQAFGAHGHAISLIDFSMQTEDGLVLPATTISESFLPARGGKPEKTAISAKLLDLRTVAAFAERLPLQDTQRQMLADFAPRGVLRDFSAQWQGSYPDISTYSVKGEFRDLSLNAQAPRPARPKTGTTPAQAALPGIPGFENLSGRVDATDKGGSFMLASENLSFQLPGYFSEPVMPFDRLNMQAQWSLQEQDQLLLEVKKMDFQQEGMSGSLTGKHRMSLNRPLDELSGTLDVSGRLNGFDIARLGRYLPLTTPKHLHEWLAGALVGGTLNDAKLRIKGDLAQFPFRAAPGAKPKGDFHVSGTIVKGKLNYAPTEFAPGGKAPLWPLMEDIDGSIVFDRTRMEINATAAKTQGVAVTDAKAVIPDLLADAPMLNVDGVAAGALQDFVRYVNGSPVGEWIGHFTEETRGSGNAKLALKLQMPLHHAVETKVQGALQFAGNNVVLQNVMPPLAAVNGKLEFNEKGFTLAGMKAAFLGGPVNISGGTQRDGKIAIRAEGSLTAEGVRKVYPMPVTQRSSERITGGARYSASIRVKEGRPEIVVESNLLGLGLDFPQPLRKAANEAMPLKFELLSLTSGEADLRDEMKLSLGIAIQAYYEREKAAGKDGQWRVLRGGIGVNEAAPRPDSGVIANVNMPSLDLDAWSRAVSSVISANKPAGPSQGDALNVGQYIEPEVLAARATELIVLGKKLDHVVVGASHQDGVWQANIDSAQASGYVTWNESRSGRGMGRVTARLASLVIPESAAEDVTELLEGKNETTQMPGVDIVAERFELFGKKFGHLELTANNARGPNGREWRISKLIIANPDGELKATGKWGRKDGASITDLAYTLAIADAGRLLDRFGFANLLRGGKGKMEGNLSWKGLPFSLDIPTLSGQLQLNLAAGQFLKVDPAAAKLLGVLSLQSLPRRLSLDFRDVFSEGFAFDNVSATATIAQGNAKTENFKMRGLAATVLIDGAVDIAKESQNLRVVVIPEINAGAASVVYGLAVNPVIGVGTFLAQLFLRDPLMKAFTFEYKVTGPWKDPVVTRQARAPARKDEEVAAGSGPSN